MLGDWGTREWGGDVIKELPRNIRKLFGAMHMFVIMDAYVKLTKLYNLNICNLLYINYTSINMLDIKIKKKEKILSSSARMIQVFLTYVDSSTRNK